LDFCVPEIWSHKSLRVEDIGEGEGMLQLSADTIILVILLVAAVAFIIWLRKQ
jgi:hypothetical protein